MRLRAKRATSKSLKELLTLYDDEVRKFLLKHPSFGYRITIDLSPDFLRACRKRIIKGHEKYGQDYKYKNNIKEAKFEEYDLFNYSILNACQKRYKQNLHSRRRKK